MSNEPTEKMDFLNKVLIATAAINYMASTLHTVSNEIRMVEHFSTDLSNGIKRRDEAKEAVLHKLQQVMNLLGNCQEAMPIDERVTAAAFDIVVHGKDD